MKIRRALLSGWLLVCLLLAGQFSLLVHEADHTNLATSTPCLVCLNHSNFEGAAPTPVLVFKVEITAEPVIEFVSTPIAKRYLLSAPNRARHPATPEVVSLNRLFNAV